MSVFELKFFDECGELYFVIIIVVMFDVWDLLLSLFSFFIGVVLGKKMGEGVENEIYQFLCKVIVKDVVQLWEEGCEFFLLVSKWLKIYKVGYEMKFFCWKKIVDIF